MSAISPENVSPNSEVAPETMVAIGRDALGTVVESAVDTTVELISTLPADQQAAAVDSLTHKLEERGVNVPDQKPDAEALTREERRAILLIMHQHMSPAARAKKALQMRRQRLDQEAAPSEQKSE